MLAYSRQKRRFPKQSQLATVSGRLSCEKGLNRGEAAHGPVPLETVVVPYYRTYVGRYRDLPVPLSKGEVTKPTPPLLLQTAR